jgi:hypothetical protein
MVESGMSTDDLSRLRDRVRAATGPDRELDAEITVALTPTVRTDDDLIYLRAVRRDEGEAPGTYWLHQRSGISLRSADRLTASIDAALALVERVLPGARLCAAFAPDYSSAWFVRGWGARAQHLGGTVEYPDDSRGHALTVIDAMLTAKLAEAGETEG